MTQKPPSPERADDKAGANAPEPDASPMAKFQQLTRQLLKVTPDQIKAEERRRAEAKAGERK